MESRNGISSHVFNDLRTRGLPLHLGSMQKLYLGKKMDKRIQNGFDLWGSDLSDVPFVPPKDFHASLGTCQIPLKATELAYKKPHP